MTREQHIEALLLRLQQLNSKTYDEQYLEAIMDIVWEKVIFTIAGKTAIDEAFYSKVFSACKPVKDTSGLYVLTLPSPIIHLDRVGSGIVSINQINAHEFDFVPVTNKMFSLLPNQEMYNISKKIYYEVGYSSIIFCDKMTDAIALVGVDVAMTIPFSSYGYTEHIPIPGGQATESFFDAIVSRVVGTPPADLSNKNSNPEWNRNIQAQ